MVYRNITLPRPKIHVQDADFPELLRRCVAAAHESSWPRSAIGEFLIRAVESEPAQICCEVLRHFDEIDDDE